MASPRTDPVMRLRSTRSGAFVLVWQHGMVSVLSDGERLRNIGDFAPVVVVGRVAGAGAVAVMAGSGVGMHGRGSMPRHLGGTRIRNVVPPVPSGVLLVFWFTVHLNRLA